MLANISALDVDFGDANRTDAAKVLRVTQPKVSALRRYKLEVFSVERLTVPYDLFMR